MWNKVQRLRILWSEPEYNGKGYSKGLILYDKPRHYEKEREVSLRR